jgi:hypothetical protein
MTRTRLKFERDFVRIPNEWMQDQRLSHAARGLLAELLTHPEGSDVDPASLVDRGPEGRDEVEVAVAELVEYGYLSDTPDDRFPR